MKNRNHPAQGSKPFSLTSVLPYVPVVAVLSPANLAAWGFPTGLRRLIIAADNDRAGRNTARKLAQRTQADGVEVDAVVSRGNDFNSDLQHIALERFRRKLATPS